jgi:hypothetical protein
MAEQKIYVDLNLQNNSLKNTTVGANSAMSGAGQFQYNTSNSRLEYHNGAAVKVVANLDDVTGLLDFKGGYNAATNTPNLDSSPTGVLKGDYYVVTADGLFFTEQVKIGDSLFARVDNASTLTDWVIIQSNVDIATTTTAGTMYIATQAQVTTGTETGAYAVNPATLKTELDKKVSRDGSLAMTGNLNMGTNKITDVVDPTLAQDAATKAYVDAQTGALYFTNDYLAAAWSGNTLTVTHNLNTLSPKVAAYESGELVVFTVSVTNANTVTLTKNAANAAPTSLKVGVSK